MSATSQRDHQYRSDVARGGQSIPPELLPDLHLIEAVFSRIGNTPPMPPWDRIKWAKEHLPNTYAHLAFRARWEHIDGD